MNDLEEILQQYGNDRRQQQYAAQHLRWLARRQRRVLATVACIAVIVVASVWTAIHPSKQPSDEGVIVAKDMPVSVKVSDTTIAIQDPPVEAERHVDIVEKPVIAQNEEPVIAQIIESEAPVDSPDTMMQVDEQTIPTPPLLVQLSPSDLDIQEWDAGTLPAKSGSRIDFTASVGASAMSSLSLGYAGGSNPSELNEATPLAAFNPHNSFSASLGMNYTVVKQERFTSHIGVVVSGHVQHGDMVNYDENGMSFLGIDGNTTPSQMTDVAGETMPYNIFSLYAGIPLAIEMQPNGNDATGWSLSLTLAHSLFSPDIFGGRTYGGFVPNPWKLTLGVGMLFPRSFPHSININANLLSVSKSSSIYEIGIEIGLLTMRRRY